MIKGCRRCHEPFVCKGDWCVGRGTMTRKYCDPCKTLQHRDEARMYGNEYRKINRLEIRKKQNMKYNKNKNKRYE
jgi:hypothetical protein